MEDREALIETKCPFCKGSISIKTSWIAGGMNDYGGMVVECANASCKKKHVIHVGKDIYNASIVSGANLLDIYDDELNNREEVLKKHGL